MAIAASKIRHRRKSSETKATRPAQGAGRLEGYLDLLCDLGATRSARHLGAHFEHLFAGLDFAGRRVLDIGGGDGRYSYYAALMGAREVVCLEPGSDGAVGGEEAHFTAIRELLPDLPVRRDRCTIQEYRDSESFDVILMIASINHVDEDACVHLLDDPRARARYRAVFAHIAALAAPGAKMVVTDCTRHNLFPALGLRNPLAPTIEWEKHQAPRAWAQLLDEAGFGRPRVSWEPLHRFGALGRRLLGNPAAAYLLKGMFRLEVERPRFGEAGREAPGAAGQADVVVLRPREAAPRGNAISLHHGEQAQAVLADPAFEREWGQLARACPWATPFQSSHFVTTWLRHYAYRYSPVVIAMRSQEGALTGLLVLAYCLRRKQLVVAGGHQAEYHAWLALPDCQREFIVRALAELDRILPGHDLTFKYLPHGMPLQELLGSPLLRGRTAVVTHRRPLLRLDEADVRESLRKKSNKSRWSRLQKLGAVEFSRITDPDAFAAVFDQIIQAYDARQGAAHGVWPFAQDPRKKGFHLELMRRQPGFLHVTVTTLAGKVIAAHVGIVGPEAVHLAILSHDEAFAEHSPGKLHLLRLGQLLLHEKVATLDLTPGGDPWKERFANAHDEVHVLTFHRTAASRTLRALRERSAGLVKGTARAIGIRPQRVRRLFGALRRRRASSGAATHRIA